MAKPATLTDDKPPAEVTPIRPRTKAQEDGIERLTVPIKDGAIHWEGVRSTRRDDLRKVLGASGLGAPPAPREDSPVMNRALCSTVLDVLAQVESLIAVRVYGCTIEQAINALGFTSAEKEMLTDPTVKVLNKYVDPVLLAKYGDELMLLVLLGNLTRNKFQVLRDSLAGHDKPADVNTETH